MTIIFFEWKIALETICCPLMHNTGGRVSYPPESPPEIWQNIVKGTMC
jgi:hypothetical protein